MDKSNHCNTHSVLITGASSGLGAACALEMDRLGWWVFAGVRSTEAGNQLVERARIDNDGSRIVPITLDVTEEDSIAAAAAVIKKSVGGAGLDALVNNAGIAVAGPFEIVRIERFRRQLEVNVVGQLAVTQAVLPLLRTARGRIVNMGSVSGRLSSPYLGPYCASKFAIAAVNDALRVELAGWGISVSLIEPASIVSKIWDKADRDIERLRAETSPEGAELYADAFECMSRVTGQCAKTAMPVEKVTRVVRHALTARRPKTRYLVVPPLAKVIYPLVFSLPDRIRDWVITRGT